MTDTYADLDTALEAVVTAARAHLAAVKAAAGQPDDDAVWRAYVTLNNAARGYDSKLDEAFGEVTPWDLEEISPEEAVQRFGTVTGASAEEPEPVDDPHPRMISVRQRRDYRVPSVTALLRAAGNARRAVPPRADEAEPVVDVAAVGTVGEAVLELLQNGDGSLAMLDVPELEPVDGLVTVCEVDRRPGEGLGDAPFAAADAVLGRLDERPFVEQPAAGKARVAD